MIWKLIICCCICCLSSLLHSQNRTIVCVDSSSNSQIEKFQLTRLNYPRTVQYISKRGKITLEPNFGDTLTFLVVSKKYENRIITLSPNSVETIVKLQKKTLQLEEVTVQSSTIHSSSEIGKLSLNKKEIEKLPTLLGESDPIRVMQLLPGIQSSGDGNGIFVRGGGIDQNLVLLDGMPIYNISHLFGFFSVFNSGAIQKMEIHKGGMPAEYGGRVSSVIDITSQVANLRTRKAEVSLGLLSAAITVQQPLKKDTSSLMISGRRTYYDGIKKLFLSDQSKYNTNYYFYDFQAKYYHRWNTKNKLTLSAFIVHDNFIYDDNITNEFKNDINWGTLLFQSTYRHDFNSFNFLESTIGISSYDNSSNLSVFSYSMGLKSLNNDLVSKINFVHQKHVALKVKVGVEGLFHQISPNNYSAAGVQNTVQIANRLKLYSQELTGYFSATYQPNDRFRMDAGIRLTNYQQLGPFQRFDFASSTEAIVAESFSKNQTVKGYMYPEPRLSMNYQLSTSTSLKFGATKNYQYLHLVPVSSITLPTDVWMPSSQLIQPQSGEQYSLGYYRTFRHQIEASTEVYYKRMAHLIEYKEGVISVIKLQSNFDENFFFGSGESYGIEWLLRKSSGKFSGWIGYTLSASTRSFPDIENGRTFWAKNDRRNDISCVLSYQISSKWSSTFVFVYKTGNAITIPMSRYFINGNIVNTYSEKNSYRLPAYHRADISISYTNKKTEKFESSFNFSVFNVYAQQNPFYVYYQTSGDISKYQIQTTAKQVSLFTFIPSISWKCIF
jgi:hypothetical protein